VLLLLLLLLLLFGLLFDRFSLLANAGSNNITLNTNGASSSSGSSGLTPEIFERMERKQAEYVE
jgi:hypothetical protein